MACWASAGVTASAFRSVAVTNPAAPWLGGKRRLAKRLVALLEAVPHRIYVEPFVGMGGVFFRRRQAPPIEVINDLNRDVHTFFRVLQTDYSGFLERMRFQISSRVEFDRLARMDPAPLSELERAARFFYLQRLCFGGRSNTRTFGVTKSRANGFNPHALAALLEDIHLRLGDVIIEAKPFADVIRSYDDPATLFYADPPYWGCESDYGRGLFAPADFELLADTLGRIRGRFVLSINDVPEIREIFRAFYLEEVRLNYTVNGPSTEAAELIITNFDVAALAGGGGQGALL